MTSSASSASTLALEETMKPATEKLVTQTISTTIENLVKTFVFGPDCTVDNVLPGGDVALQNQILPHEFQLTAIDDNAVVDSGELKSILLQHAASGRINIQATFTPVTLKTDKVQIEDSVLCNGTPSVVRSESKEAVMEMLKNIQQTPNNSISADNVDVVYPNKEYVNTWARENVEINNNHIAQETSDTTIDNNAATSAHSEKMEKHANLCEMQSLPSAQTSLTSTSSLQRNNNDNDNDNNNNNKHRSTSCKYENDKNNSNHSSHTEWPQQRQLTSPRSHRKRVSDADVVIGDMRSASSNSIGSGNSSDSEISEEFNSVQFSPVNRRAIDHASNDKLNERTNRELQLAMSPRLPGSNESPTLLEFDKMGLSLRAEDATKLATMRSLTGSPNCKEASVRARLARALEKVKPLNCVICITQDFNPIAEIELLAMSMHRRLVAIDLGVKLRLRPRFEVFATEFKEAMRLGAWFVLVNAHKSMSSCQHLEELVHELREEISNTEKLLTSSSMESKINTTSTAKMKSNINHLSKIIISLEPHPHFPRGLVEGAVVIKLTSSFDNSPILSESIATSSMRNRLVTADTLSASQLGTLIRQPITITDTTCLGKDNKAQRKKRVRISAAVDIVDIPPREALRINANAMAGGTTTPSSSTAGSAHSNHSNNTRGSRGSNTSSNNNNNNSGPIDVSGTVALMKSFMGVPGDKFLCVQRAGEIGRFAVGSSLGNLYFLDSLGNSLLQAHAHNASIWDVSFADKYHFATGCEDGTAASWQLASFTEPFTHLEEEEQEQEQQESCKEQTVQTWKAAREQSEVKNNNNNMENNAIISAVKEKTANANLSQNHKTAMSPTSISNDEMDAGIVPTAATSLGDDVYCVSYVNGAETSTLPPLVIGGLHSAVVIRTAHSTSVSLVPISSNAQVADSLPSYSVSLVGGGDGSITVIDVATASVLATLHEHSRKVPALTVSNDHVFFSGAFDSTILSWDVRLPNGVANNVPVPNGVSLTEKTSNSTLSAHTLHTLKLKNYVTGLSVDNNHLAATVGENLYLWDVRNLNTVLGGYPQGWKGLTRGIKVQSTDHIVVTGSQDGQVRFWTFV